MFSLNKDKKLKSKKAIEELFEKGEKLKDGPVLMIYRLAEGKNSKIAVSAKKRNIKQAVKRNKIKRLLREAYRLNQKELTQSYNLFFVYLGKEIESFDYFNRKIKQLLIRLNKSE